jgi:hypothetical protein
LAPSTGSEALPRGRFWYGIKQSKANSSSYAAHRTRFERFVGEGTARVAQVGARLGCAGGEEPPTCAGPEERARRGTQELAWGSREERAGRGGQERARRSAEKLACSGGKERAGSSS